MDPNPHESESPTAAADLPKQEEAIPGSFLSTKANSANCYIQCSKFFKKRGAIPLNVLFSCWMMAGCLGPVGSIGEACQKGQAILEDLTQQGMLRIVYEKDRDRYLIEFVKSEKHLKPIHCKHQGFCIINSFENVLTKGSEIIDTITLTDGNLKQRKVEANLKYKPRVSERWQDNWEKSRYVAQFNPTTDSVNHLLQNLTNLYVLLLRGCNELLPPNPFPLRVLKTLTVLEISGSSHLTSIPANTISKLTQLRYLNLSHLLIQSFPPGFFQGLKDLQWLILRGCSNLLTLSLVDLALTYLDLSGSCRLNRIDDSLKCQILKVLDLSRTQIESIELVYRSASNVDPRPLRNLILRDCTHLKELPAMTFLLKLMVLDASGCVKLLELSEDVSRLKNLIDLNLSGCSGLGTLPEGLFNQMSSLQKLDLSSTNVKVLPDLSKLGSLEELLLADCRHLRVVPDLQTLTKLETLDLSISVLQDESESHKVIIPLSTPSSLRKLVLTNRSGLQKLFALTSLGCNLEFLDLRGTDVTSIPRQYMEQIKCIHLPTRTDLSEVGQGKVGNLEEARVSKVSKPFEIHIVSNAARLFSNRSEASSSHQSSGFNRSNYKDEIDKLHDLISEMQEIGVSVTTVGVARTLQLEKLGSDVSYLRGKWARLKSSQDKKEVDELLRELMDATTHLSAADFLDDFSYFRQLLRIVIKLKLLIPPEPDESLLTRTGSLKIRNVVTSLSFEDSQPTMEKTKKKKKKLWFITKNNEDDIFIVKDSSSHEFKDLLSSYDSLTSFQQYCLLCFSAFPVDKKRSLMVKKRMLIYLWAGEGFLEDSSADTSFEEVGKAVLRVLEDKGFIQPVMEKSRESGSCCMSPFVHEFITAKANEEGFFDFDPKKGELTPQFTRSQRACLVNTSCKLWADSKYYHENKESFKNARTLFNVNESVVDIKPEWFSNMKHLKVLHLGIWRYDHQDDPIEVYDVKFLEESERMKTMRLLSLQGIFRINKLPDSVCKLTDLIILDLRDCTNLEELPKDIGSLKSLTHLDLTSCYHLIEVPKGIRQLSKLEVLKGFVITIQSCDPQNRKSAQLKDLLNLNKLRKLNIVVRINVFPDDQELQVLRDMDSLCKLKITWEKDYNFTHEEWISPETLTHGQQAIVRPSKWKKMKCWEHGRSSQDDREETSRNRHLGLGHIQKLELWCYPFETAPHWLSPGELKSLKKLYICGGNLAKLHHKWNVTALRFKYLPNLEMRWRDLKNMFPDLTYLEKHQCPKLPFFQCDYEGVWIRERDEK